MDEVDQKQQEEIIGLQKKDVHHDRELFWMKLVGFVIVMWTLVATVMVFQALEMIQKVVMGKPQLSDQK